MSEYVFESDGYVKIEARYYPSDGAQVKVWRCLGGEWLVFYDMRVIADNLWETLYMGLCGADLEDMDAIEFLDSHGIEYPDDEED